MSSYDLTRLNPREFEALSADILSEIEQCRVERFKEGRDGGIDGRFFSTEKEEVIIQCKHYTKSGISNLVRHLEKRELVKIKKLNPKRYILTTSIDLSPDDKKKIQDALSPYIKLSTDILGKQDITAFLSKNPDIERRHYKLWITSSNVILALFNNAIIGRSEFKLEQIKNSSSKYVLTSDYQKAIDKLDEKGCLIITGSPGIGKTTLANQILLKYASERFEVCYIEKSVNEAEAIFIKGKNQIFYFDDFLGSNVLESLDKHEDSQIVSFLKRVSNDKSKRFILTSRTVILNKAKTLSEKFEIENINEREYEIKISSLDKMDKAKILYNHIWHSDLEEEYINELYQDKRYRKIIEHKNYNPRLISFITNQKRVNDINSSDYWRYINETLNNPTDIWDYVFKNQISNLCAISVYLTALNGKDINELDLKTSFSNMALYDKLSELSVVENEFENIIKIAIGSVLNRKINLTNRDTKYSLFDPSIGDYVIKKIRKNPLLLESCFLHLNTTDSLKSLEYLILSKDASSKILESLVVQKLNSESISDSYKIQLSQLAIKSYNNDEILAIHLKKFWPYFCKIQLRDKIIEVCEIYIWYINQGIAKEHTEHLIKLLHYFLTQPLDHYECGAILKLSDELKWNMEYDIEYDKIDYEKIKEIITIKDELKELFLKHWKSIINEEATNYIDSDIIGYDAIYEEVVKFIEDKLSEFEFEFDENEIESIIEHCNIEKIVEFNNTEIEFSEIQYNSWKEYRSYYENDIDPIDDLFSRDAE